MKDDKFWLNLGLPTTDQTEEVRNSTKHIEKSVQDLC